MLEEVMQARGLVKIALQIEPENSIELQFKDILEEKINTSSQHVYKDS